MSEFPFVERLIQENMPIWHQCLDSEFLRKLADGTLAGSATNLYDCMRKAVEFGIPKEQAILSATLIPARELGCENEIGSIAPGKRADFVVCDEEVNRKTVFLCGKPLKNSVAENNKGRNLNTEIQRGGI